MSAFFQNKEQLPDSKDQRFQKHIARLKDAIKQIELCMKNEMTPLKDKEQYQASIEAHGKWIVTLSNMTYDIPLHGKR